MVKCVRVLKRTFSGDFKLLKIQNDTNKVIHIVFLGKTRLIIYCFCIPANSIGTEFSQLLFNDVDKLGKKQSQS